MQIMGGVSLPTGLLGVGGGEGNQVVDPVGGLWAGCTSYSRKYAAPPPPHTHTSIAPVIVKNNAFAVAIWKDGAIAGHVPQE